MNDNRCSGALFDHFVSVVKEVEYPIILKIESAVEQHSLVMPNKITFPLRELIERCSSFYKVLRSTVYVLRFMKKLPHNSLIQASDLSVTKLFLVGEVQRENFTSEIYVKERTCVQIFNILEHNVSNIRIPTNV